MVLGLLTASCLMHKRGVPGNYILMSVFLNVFLVFQGGLTMLIGSLIFSLITPDYKKDYFSAYILALPLMYGIGKIGCSIEGCCAGIQYEGPFAIRNVLGIKIFPVQIVEVIVFLELFIVSLIVEYKGKYEPFTAAIIYAAVKILLDFFRDTHSTKFITPNQYFCMWVIIFCAILKLGTKKHKDPNDKETVTL